MKKKRISNNPQIDTVVAYCRKPNCERYVLHRHHKRHEALWIGLFNNEGLLEWTDNQITKLKKEYNLFIPERIIYICSWHHAEIHMLYDGLLIRHMRLMDNKHLVDYTWKEACEVMSIFENSCNNWLKKETPGFDPDYLKVFRNVESLQIELKEY